MASGFLTRSRLIVELTDDQTLSNKIGQGFFINVPKIPKNALFDLFDGFVNNLSS